MCIYDLPAHLDQNETDQWTSLLASYSYPPVICDLLGEPARTSGRSLLLQGGIRAVERTIRQDLIHDDRSTVKRGLLRVLFWGHFTNSKLLVSSPREFWMNATDAQLDAFVEFRAGIFENAGTALEALAAVGLPQFGASFLTKLLMFLHSESGTFPVLDSRIARWIERQCNHGAHKSNWNGVQVALGTRTIQNYSQWQTFCRHIAEMLGNEWRVVDVERSVFQKTEVDRASEKIIHLARN
jgi:hypothetical protein